MALTTTILQESSFALRELKPSSTSRNDRSTGNTLIHESHAIHDSEERPDLRDLERTAPAQVSTRRAALITLQMSTINFLTSMVSGVIVVGLPRIALDVQLDDKLYLWPTSVYGLTTGSTLLIAGSVADVVGARIVDMTGIFLTGVFTLCCGLSRTGIGLVICRALQGVSVSMHFPSSMSIVARYIPSGRERNISFACLGLSMPLGFAFGLVLGGILVDTIGWRTGFYIPAVILLLQTVFTFRLIPADVRQERPVQKLIHNIDWVGAAISCTSLAMFSYVLAVISADAENVRLPSTIALLVISVALMPLFPWWMSRQTRLGKPALIPNSIWRSLPFTAMCLITLLLWGFGNSMELFSSLYFQEVQELPALQASLRILPALLMGVLLNFLTGWFVDKANIFWLTLGALILSAGGPLIMALIDPAWPYWYGAFPSQILAPIAGDILFTIGMIVVSNSFPEETQGLAGAVYNTVAYFGWSFGVNLMQVVSMLVTRDTSYRDKNSPEALLQGYRASFWALTGFMVSCVVIAVFGLRNIGRVGVKRE